MPTTQTVAVRMPARITGSARGSSTRHSDCRGVMPTPRAASRIAGSTSSIPVKVFRRIGSTL